jgi:hypothetical protein
MLIKFQIVDCDTQYSEIFKIYTCKKHISSKSRLVLQENLPKITFLKQNDCLEIETNAQGKI